MKPTIYCCRSYEDMSRRAADHMAAQVLLKPHCVLGLATGSTPLGLYGELAARCQRAVLFHKVVDLKPSFEIL